MVLSKITSQQLSALVLLVKSIFDQVDEIANLKKNGGQANISSLILQEMCSVLSDLPAELEQAYFSILISLAGKHPIPAPNTYSEEYATLSAESKRRLVSNLRTEFLRASG